MIKKTSAIVLMVVSVILLLTACMPKENETPQTGAGLGYEEFMGKEIGVAVGAVSEHVVLESFNGTPVYYSDMTAGIEDVRMRRIDGFMMNYISLRLIASENEDLAAIEVPVEFFSAEVGGMSNDQAVLDGFNAMLSTLEADGTLAEMQTRWLEDIIDLATPMPEIPLTGENGTLRVATTADRAPFAYIGENGEQKGISVELALRFAAYAGKDIEFIEMEFGALIQHVVSGKSDLAISNMSITEERKKSVGFTEPYTTDILGIITLNPNATVSAYDAAGFIETLKTAIERNLITENRWKLIVDGLGVTMTIAALAQLFGTVFGAFVCFVLMRKNRFVNWLGRLYCGLIHGTPIVVLLMITYYIIFGSTSISNVLIAVAAFTMVTGAGVAVNLKGAIDTIDPVEIEAARSIGFSAFRAFTTVTLPQAVKRALPGYSNGFVELVKATAIVGYIAIQDLTRAGDIIRSRTYDAYFPLLYVAVIYLIVTTICVQLFKFIVKRINGELDKTHSRRLPGGSVLDKKVARLVTGGDLAATYTSEAEKGDG